MIVRVLDTGALIRLLKPRTDIHKELARAVDDGDEIVTPAIVMAEIAQATEPFRKRLEALKRLVARIDVTEWHADTAARALRAVSRAKCQACGGFDGPSIVDAVVVALAADCVQSGHEPIVYTQDIGDLELLRDAVCKDVALRRV